MKKLLALIMALMVFLLAACGQKADNNASTNEDGLYVVEHEKNGTKITEYRQGSKNGTLVKEEVVPPFGGLIVNYFDENGNITRTDYTDPSGFSTQENYPSDNAAPDFQHDGNDRTNDDGSHWETYTNEDGSVSNFRMKNGILLESNTTDANGYYFETHYTETGIKTKHITINNNSGWTNVEEYYGDETLKSEHKTYENSNEYGFAEYYENGNPKYAEYMTEDGNKTIINFNSNGNCSYIYKLLVPDEYEYSANENGELIKYVENGTVYEGGQITNSHIDKFNMYKNFIQP